MAELKTQPNDNSVEDFIKAIEPENRREDCRKVLQIMQQETGANPMMWGDSIVGFGRYHYTYKSGHSGSWFLTGFSPRKQNLTVYIMPGFSEFEVEMKALEKHKHSKSCLYIKKLDDVDLSALENLIAASVIWLRENYAVD